jgi:translation initiation factor IF-2
LVAIPSWSHNGLAQPARAGGSAACDTGRGGSHARDEGHRERRDARTRRVQAPAAAQGSRRTGVAPRPAASPVRAPAGREQRRQPGDGARAAARAPAPPGATRTTARRCDRARAGEGPASGPRPGQGPWPSAGCRRRDTGPGAARRGHHAPPGRRAHSRAPPAGTRARPGGPRAQAAGRAPGCAGRRFVQEFRALAAGQRQRCACGHGPAGQAQAGAAQKVTRALNPAGAAGYPAPGSGGSSPVFS